MKEYRKTEYDIIDTSDCASFQAGADDTVRDMAGRIVLKRIYCLNRSDCQNSDANCRRELTPK